MFPIAFLNPNKVRDGDNPDKYDLPELADNDIYKVEKILDYKGGKRSRSYFVR